MEIPSPQSAMRFALDRTRHAAPQVFSHLRSLIISLSLPPGTVLSRGELAQQYNISQTPVRDALLKLSEEGLIEIYPQHATVVSRIDVSLAEEAHFLRLSVEMEVARVLAAQPAAELVDQLHALINKQRLLVGEDMVSEFTALDQAFHKVMYEAAKVPHLYALVRRHSGHLDRLRRLDLPTPGKTLAVVNDHAKIVEAIGAGDPALAAHCVRTHLSGTLARVGEIRVRYRDYLKD